MPTAPLRVPVEVQRASTGEGRWFRLADGVSVERLELTTALPEEVDGPLALRFHLPGMPEPVRCHGRAVEVVVGQGDDERAERRGLELLDLDEAGRARIEGYLLERLGP